MIKEIHLKNILSHQDSTLVLVDGMNVIKGPSHNGKSVIMFGAELPLTNSPSVDVFKPTFAKKGDVISSKLVFDNGSVERSKKGTTNKYIVVNDKGEEEVLTAMKRSEVPDEVARIT